jgi:hypothetical protein
MRSFLAAAVLLALVVTGTAVASHGDAKRKLTPADQARAKAMLLRKADLPPAFQAKPRTPDTTHFYCKALDESDLTLSGDAESRVFDAQVLFAQSAAQVYRTLANAKASWRRSTSTDGIRCLRTLIAREYQKAGVQLRSFRPIAFPKVSAGRTLAYRLTLASQGVPAYLDFIGIEHGRAHVNLGLGSALQPFPKVEAVKLARLLAKRMATAMRGA